MPQGWIVRLFLVYLTETSLMLSTVISEHKGYIQAFDILNLLLLFHKAWLGTFLKQKLHLRFIEFLADSSTKQGIHYLHHCSDVNKRHTELVFVLICFLGKNTYVVFLWTFNNKLHIWFVWKLCPLFQNKFSCEIIWCFVIWVLNQQYCFG